MARWTFCWYDTIADKANSIDVQAKDKETAIVLFAQKLESLHKDEVEGFCIFKAEIAIEWVKDNFPHYVGWNVLVDKDLHRQELSFEISSPLL